MFQVLLWLIIVIFSGSKRSEADFILKVVIDWNIARRSIELWNKDGIRGQYFKMKYHGQLKPPQEQKYIGKHVSISREFIGVEHIAQQISPKPFVLYYV